MLELLVHIRDQLVDRPGLDIGAGLLAPGLLLGLSRKGQLACDDLVGNQSECEDILRLVGEFLVELLRRHEAWRAENLPGAVVVLLPCHVEVRQLDGEMVSLPFDK